LIAIRRLLLALSALALAGCARRAPGPEECRIFAHQVVGVPLDAPLGASPVRERIDELTRQCLVTPFDRELLRCVELGAPLRACTLEFGLRRAERASFGNAR